MDEQEQITHFSNDIDALVDRYREEYDMMYSSFLGVMFMKCHLLMNEASSRYEDKNDKEDDWKGSI